MWARYPIQSHRPTPPHCPGAVTPTDVRTCSSSASSARRVTPMPANATMMSGSIPLRSIANQTALWWCGWCCGCGRVQILSERRASRCVYMGTRRATDARRQRRPARPGPIRTQRAAPHSRRAAHLTAPNPNSVNVPSQPTRHTRDAPASMRRRLRLRPGALLLKQAGTNGRREAGATHAR